MSDNYDNFELLNIKFLYDKLRRENQTLVMKLENAYIKIEKLEEQVTYLINIGVSSNSK
jgi:hypothetical protein